MSATTSPISSTEILMKTCDRCPNPATSRNARYCMDCQKLRQSENGAVQGKRNAAKGRIHVEPREN